MAVAREQRQPGPWWQLGLGRENGLAFWAMGFVEGSFGAFFPIWPLYIEYLGAPIALVGLLLGVSGLMRFFTLLPTASLARRFGNRRMLLASRVISAIGISLAAFAPSWPWLLPILVASAAGSMTFPLIMTHVSANAPEGTRVRAFTLAITIAPSVAMAVAPFISAGLIKIFDIRAPFIFSGVLSLIAVTILSRTSGIPPEEEPSEDHNEDTSTGYLAALRYRPVRNILILKIATVFTLGLGTQLVPNYLNEVGGYADDTIALLSAFSAIGTLAFGTMVVRNQRFSEAPLMGTALAVLAVGVAFLLLLMPEIVPFVVLAFLFRGGVFAAISLVAAELGELTPARIREHTFTMSEMGITGGFALAPVVAGVLYGVFPSLPLIVAMIGSVPLALLMLRLNGQRQVYRQPEFRTATATDAVGEQGSEGQTSGGPYR